MCFKLRRERNWRVAPSSNAATSAKSRYFCLCASQVVVTVFAETNALSPDPASVAQDSDTEGGEGPTLTFNLYCPKLSQSVDIDLPHAMQKMMTGEFAS